MNSRVLLSVLAFLLGFCAVLAAPSGKPVVIQTDFQSEFDEDEFQLVTWTRSPQVDDLTVTKFEQIQIEKIEQATTSADEKDDQDFLGGFVNDCKEVVEYLKSLIESLSTETLLVGGFICVLSLILNLLLCCCLVCCCQSLTVGYSLPLDEV